MLTALQNGMRVVGAKQTLRALREGRVKTVFLAQDADPRVTQPVEALCAELAAPVERAATMKELGAACEIAVGAAVAALLRD